MTKEKEEVISSAELRATMRDEIQALKKENEELAKQYVDSRAIEGCLEKKLENLEKEISQREEEAFNAGRSSLQTGHNLWPYKPLYETFQDYLKHREGK